jgi:hypothetical protein
VSVPAAVLRAALAAATTLLVALPAAAGAQEPAPAPPPSVALTGPTPGATIGAGVATPLTATESGAFKVISFHLDGGAPICIFTRAHDTYVCPWTPDAAAIGPHTITARVEAPDGQVATASLPLTVGRLLPQAVGARTTRRHVHGGGWRLTTTGRVTVPAGMPATACGGSATVTVVSHGRTVVDRTVAVEPDCRFSSRVTFAAPRSARKLQVRVAFGGARLLAPRSAPVQTLRLR